MRAAGVLTGEKGLPLMPCEIALAFRREYTSSGVALPFPKGEKGPEKCTGGLQGREQLMLYPQQRKDFCETGRNFFI